MQSLVAHMRYTKWLNFILFSFALNNTFYYQSLRKYLNYVCSKSIDYKYKVSRQPGRPLGMCWWMRSQEWPYWMQECAGVWRHSYKSHSQWCPTGILPESGSISHIPTGTLPDSCQIVSVMLLQNPQSCWNPA